MGCAADVGSDTQQRHVLTRLKRHSLQNIFSCFTSLGLELDPFFDLQFTSHNQFDTKHPAVMSSNKGKARATSTSPTQAQDDPASKPAKVGDGGVKLPNDTEKVDEKK